MHTSPAVLLNPRNVGVAVHGNCVDVLQLITSGLAAAIFDSSFLVTTISAGGKGT